jgi:deoxyribodipyrimidine photo-lyase
MVNSLRIHYNYALDYALHVSKTYDIPLEIIVFRKSEQHDRNNHFFNDMTSDLLEKLTQFTPSVTMIKDDFDELKSRLENTEMIVKDMGYLSIGKSIDEEILMKARELDQTFVLVENKTVVPVMVASDKLEYAARTIRKKIMARINDYLEPVLTDYTPFKGEVVADELLNLFITEKLSNYDDRNDPSHDYQSHLSPYLKYGFIHPSKAVNAAYKTTFPTKDGFVEELVVRRELAFNYVFYQNDYEKFENCTYDWAYQTMDLHKNDSRDYIYTKEDYILFNTHDPYFNAAMKEMVYFGTMHNYMRMYWAKKIIEWSSTYEEAFYLIQELNDTYFLDGNTPNGYTNVAWCFGRHDRAFTERPVFGKLRYMNDKGLERKFNIKDYVDQIERKIK